MDITYTINYSNIKPSLKEDFYNNINYEWLISNKIPEDEDKYTHFIETQYDINHKLKKILESNVSPLATVMYNSYLNNQYRNTYCKQELIDILKLVDIAKTHKDLIIMNVRLLFINVNTLFDMNIDLDIYNSCNTVLYITQANTGLPNKVYYTDSKYKDIRQSYYDTICKIYSNLFPNLTTKELNKIASLIINIEKSLSIIFLDPEQRDSELVFHRYSLDEVHNKYTNLHIKSIIQTLCVLSENVVIEENFKEIIIEHNDKDDYFKQLELLLLHHTVEEWQIFFKYKILLNYINLTDIKLKEIFFNMFKKILKGQKKPKEEWRTGVSYTCLSFNDTISRIYVHNYFSQKTEDYIMEMIKSIKKVTKERILKLDWMSSKTKKKAILKLHKMGIKIGYSKTFPRNYNHLILTDSIIKNSILINRDNLIHNLNKLNSRVNPHEWDIPSYIVNAYYSPTQNEIIFPASILQKPFFDLSKSDIYNYANIGSVIGHEIIHGFDDQGSKYDENGSINNWWSDEDNRQYTIKVEQIIKIYQSEGINGKLTAGENIADFGSVILPLHALEYKLNRKLTTEEIKEYYISYAIHWQYLLTKEVIQERVLTDPHAFAHLRVNIPVKHQKIFQEAFEINKGDKMYVDPNDMLNIW
jgi:putative endopeptidase